jgi:hypothetical protein
MVQVGGLSSSQISRDDEVPGVPKLLMFLITGSKSRTSSIDRVWGDYIPGQFAAGIRPMEPPIVSGMPEREETGVVQRDAGPLLAHRGRSEPFFVPFVFFLGHDEVLYGRFGWLGQYHLVNAAWVSDFLGGVESRARRG